MKLWLSLSATDEWRAFARRVVQRAQVVPLAIEIPKAGVIKLVFVEMPDAAKLTVLQHLLANSGGNQDCLLPEGWRNKSVDQQGKAIIAIYARK